MDLDLRDKPEINVGLVACGKAKLDHPSPARDLYTGNLFRAASSYAQSHYDAWMILSARHFLLHPDDVVTPYDFTMAELTREEIKQWALHVDISLRVGHRPPTPGILSQGPEVALSKYLKAGTTVHLWLHAGQSYVDPLIAWRTNSWSSFHTPLAGLGIGVQLAWYASRSERHTAGA